MRVTVCFYSWFKELTGCSRLEETLPAGSTVDTLLGKLTTRFSNLTDLQRSMLIAIGVEYQGRDYVLNEGDEVSLFPPVQGG
jgi:molybdopterin converting factor small subunit